MANYYFNGFSNSSSNPAYVHVNGYTSPFMIAQNTLYTYTANTSSITIDRIAYNYGNLTSVNLLQDSTIKRTYNTANSFTMLSSDNLTLVPGNTDDSIGYNYIFVKNYNNLTLIPSSSYMDKYKSVNNNGILNEDTIKAATNNTNKIINVLTWYTTYIPATWKSNTFVYSYIGSVGVPFKASYHVFNSRSHSTSTAKSTYVSNVKDNSKYLNNGINTYTISLPFVAANFDGGTYVHVSAFVRDYVSASGLEYYDGEILLGNSSVTYAIHTTQVPTLNGYWTYSWDEVNHRAYGHVPYDDSVRAYHDSDHFLQFKVSDAYKYNIYNGCVKYAYFSLWNPTKKAYEKVSDDFASTFNDKNFNEEIKYNIPELTYGTDGLSASWKFEYGTYAPTYLYFSKITDMGGYYGFSLTYNNINYSEFIQSTDNFYITFNPGADNVLFTNVCVYPSYNINNQTGFYAYSVSSLTYKIDGSNATNINNGTFSISRGISCSITPKFIKNFNITIIPNIVTNISSILLGTSNTIKAYALQNNSSTNYWYDKVWNQFDTTKTNTNILGHSVNPLIGGFIGNVGADWITYIESKNASNNTYFSGIKAIAYSLSYSNVISVDYSYYNTRKTTISPCDNSIELHVNALNLGANSYVDVIPMCYMYVKHPSTLTDQYKEITLKTSFTGEDGSSWTTCKADFNEATANTIVPIKTSSNTGMYVAYNTEATFSINAFSSSDIESIKLSVYNNGGSNLVGIVTAKPSAGLSYKFKQGLTSYIASVEVTKRNTPILKISSKTSISNGALKYNFNYNSTKKSYDYTVTTDNTGSGTTNLSLTDTSNLKLENVQYVNENNAGLRLANFTINTTNKSGSTISKTYTWSDTSQIINDTCVNDVTITSTLGTQDKAYINFSQAHVPYRVSFTTAAYNNTLNVTTGNENLVCYTSHLNITNISISNDYITNSDGNMKYSDVCYYLDLRIWDKDKNLIISQLTISPSTINTVNVKKINQTPLYKDIDNKYTATIDSCLYLFPTYVMLGDQKIEYSAQEISSGATTIPTVTVDNPVHTISHPITYKDTIGFVKCDATDTNYKFSYFIVQTVSYTNADYTGNYIVNGISTGDGYIIKELNKAYSLLSTCATLTPYTKVFFKPWFTDTSVGDIDIEITNQYSDFYININYELNGHTETNHEIDKKTTVAISDNKAGTTFKITAVNVDPAMSWYTFDYLTLNGAKYDLNTLITLASDNNYEFKIYCKYNANKVPLKLSFNGDVGEGLYFKYNVLINSPWFRFTATDNYNNITTIDPNGFTVDTSVKYTPWPITLSISYIGTNTDQKFDDNTEIGFNISSINNDYYVADSNYTPYKAKIKNFVWNLDVSNAFKKNSTLDITYKVTVQNTSGYDFKGSLIPYNIKNNKLYTDKSISFNILANNLAYNLYTLPNDIDIAKDEYAVVAKDLNLYINNKWVECKYKLNVYTTTIPTTYEVSLMTIKNSTNSNYVFNVSININNETKYSDAVALPYNGTIQSYYPISGDSTADIKITVANTTTPLPKSFKLINKSGQTSSDSSSTSLNVTNIKLSDTNKDFYIEFA